MAIGLLMIFEGLPYFTMPDSVKSVAKMIPEMENRTLRLIGFGLMVCGLIIVAFVRL